MENLSNQIEKYFFSVIITTYNREKTVLRAVNSLLGQSEPDFEAIIVDDGSTDETFDILKDIIFSNRNFKYIFQSNHGSPHAKNSGILNSSGKYITFLDSDDEYHPNHLLIRKKILTDRPEIEFLHGGVRIIGNQFIPDKNSCNYLININDCIVGGTFFIKGYVFDKIGYFPIVPYSDDSMFFEIAQKANVIIAKTEISTYIYHRDVEESACLKIKR